MTDSYRASIEALVAREEVALGKTANPPAKAVMRRPPVGLTPAALLQAPALG
jgi:NAD(P)H-quinone oxidoreductase subunit 4